MARDGECAHMSGLLQGAITSRGISVTLQPFALRQAH
jgi:hypothetical protein